MGDWNRVKWTQARQVAAAMGVREAQRPDAGVTPAAYYATLRDGGDLATATRFIGHALPRFEAVAWASRAVAEMEREPPAPTERTTMAHILRWLADPSDESRRAIWEMAEAGDGDTPEYLLAGALFFSGGSIAPVDLPAVQPAPEVAGRLAAAAVMIAAYATPDPQAALAEALTIGEALAATGKA